MSHVDNFLILPCVEEDVPYIIKSLNEGILQTYNRDEFFRIMDDQAGGPKKMEARVFGGASNYTPDFGTIKSLIIDRNLFKYRDDSQILFKGQEHFKWSLFTIKEVIILSDDEILKRCGDY